MSVGRDTRLGAEPTDRSPPTHTNQYGKTRFRRVRWLSKFRIEFIESRVPVARPDRHAFNRIRLVQQMTPLLVVSDK